jgi:hypothetical protein
MKRQINGKVERKQKIRPSNINERIRYLTKTKIKILLCFNDQVFNFQYTMFNTQCSSD